MPRVGVLQNTCHYTRVRRQTIQLIMSCNAFIISSLPFPSLTKLSNLTSEPYFRFREVQNLKIDHTSTGYSQVEYLSSVLSSVLPCGRRQKRFCSQSTVLKERQNVIIIIIITTTTINNNNNNNTSVFPSPRNNS